MLFYLNLALKNLFRHKLRTFVSILAVAFAVAVVVFARGYITGLINLSFADHIQYNSGHIKIIDREYYDQERVLPLNYNVDGFEDKSLAQMKSELQKLDGVELLISRLKFGAVVSTGNELINMMGWGVEKENEIEFTNIEDQLVEGRMIENGKLEVVMGTELLRKLDKKVGDSLTIVANTSFNSVTGFTVTVVGRINSSLKALNEQAFFIPLAAVQPLLYMEDQQSEILLVTPEREMTAEVLPRVKEYLNSQTGGNKYLALSYQETSDLLPYMEIAQLIYNQVYIFIVLLSSIVVINTMIMIIKERTREIGMMSALGMKSGGILKLFILEGAVMGIIGSFFGSIIGSIINNYFAVNGIDFTAALSGFDSEIMISSIIYTQSSIFNSVFAFLIGAVVVTLSCILPARRAAKLEPTAAMKER